MGPAAFPGSSETDHAPELVRLLNYLGVSYPTFALHEERYFQVLTGHLRRHGVLAATESVDRSNFQQVIRDFQRRRGLGQDGLPGEDTLWHLQHDWAASRNLTIDRVDADRHPASGGYDHFCLREDAASAYRALRQEVTGQGGIITSAGGLRSLGAAVTAGQSPTSMHYTGLALDLATDTGMRNPARDPYLITQDGRKWRVWCTSDQAQEVSLDAVVWQNGRTSTRRVQARAFDFTALANQHGFANIGPRKNFPAHYMSAEWWHFQYEAALTPFISQFGIELLSLKMYNETKLQCHRNIWDNRKRIFKRQRNGWF